MSFISHNSIRHTLVVLALAALPCRAAEHITLRNGFELDCTRREPAGDRVRLYTANNTTDFLELPAAEILRSEPALDLPAPTAVTAHPATDLPSLIQRAGATHHIDADLLASVIHAESGGRIRAVSRTGARGLMQLMPATATALGVADAFAPEQNIAGGTAYLDQLLTRYHDDLVLAVAAYNAGPGAVARYHGVPPFPETRAYVARVVREFNRRKLAQR